MWIAEKYTVGQWYWLDKKNSCRACVLSRDFLIIVSCISQILSRESLGDLKKIFGIYALGNFCPVSVLRGREDAHFKGLLIV